MKSDTAEIRHERLQAMNMHSKHFGCDFGVLACWPYKGDQSSHGFTEIRRAVHVKPKRVNFTLFSQQYKQLFVQQTTTIACKMIKVFMNAEKLWIKCGVYFVINARVIIMRALT
jgi:hypothetical protein